MEHKNTIAIDILADTYADYPRNAWHYDREYKNLVKATELSEKLNLAVVIESAFIEVFDKASCIQHWHNTGKNDEAMVVSSEKVYELWEVLEKYREDRHSL